MRRAGRVVETMCATTAAAAMLVACAADDGAGDDEPIVGTRWQVTEVYDDPALPHGVPEDTVPPTITFGRESYIAEGACGSYQGTLTWLDDGIVAVGEPETVRETDCDAVADTYDARLRAQLAGEFVAKATNLELRMTAVGEPSAGRAAPGWAAVSPYRD